MARRSLAALCAFAALLSAQTRTIEQRFAEARKNPAELYAFLLRMPKGGDLHNHLTGAVYAETYLRAAAEDGLCIDIKNYSFTGPPCALEGGSAARAESDNPLANSLIDSLSMRNFVAGRESAHDHFFATFGKFGPYHAEHRGEFVAEVARRAAEQNESYLELMAISGSPANALGSSVGFSGDFDATKEKLLSGLPDVVAQLLERLNEMDRGRRDALGCDSQPSTPPCRVVVRYMFEVLRESPKEQVFAQLLAGLMLCSRDPRVVAINFVQPEDGLRAMRDYHLHMQMIDYAKHLYPNVHITLHAGELNSGLVPPDGLRFHIREAIELGHAERIGHGASVMYENDAAGLLRLMHQRRTLVEINLTSNDLILGIRGPEHPFPIYRKYGVPVALSTDDEGVSRSHLTEEYRRAVLSYGLSYADLKDIVRNSLEYSFLPGASYWQDHAYQSAVAACAGGARGKACQTLLNSSEKARLEADLEDRFRAFEK